MKYNFEVTTNDLENIIKLDISYGSMGNTVSRSVKDVAGGDGYEKYVDELFQDVIDNMRLTVKERNDAQYNLKVLKEYLRIPTSEVTDKVMIVEKNDTLFE